ncbi:MAG TPA: GSU2203 family decaheme c-type cytochrome [Candidatus Sulfomarinibacteraceae bacterium]|nr:GSU2203 family decaheme c-type cytochrome [Candidatus Sulfomarinibacteraceae bacterium]
MLSKSLLTAALAAVCLLAVPALADDGMCADCHDEVAAGMTHQIHMRIEPFEVYGREVGCEGCHGDGTAHMEEGSPSLIRTFAEWSADDVAACMDCHGTKGMMEWNASTHAMENVACGTCHGIHEAKKPESACLDCHTHVYAEFQLPNHHPVPEKKMSCTSCHDPHAASEAMLRDNHMRLNDLCYTCHQSQEGPFIFEHEPVQESCSLCHRPHGSVADNLLTANEPMLCLQCHEFHFHAGLISPEDEHVDVGGREFSNPHGEYGMNRSFTTKCSQCHSQIHGSDLPAQSLAGAGFGMVR